MYIMSILIKSIVMEEHIGFLLSDASRLVRRAFDERARTIGVTRPQWQVLASLRRNEGSNQGTLADLLDVEPITLCRMVDRLQDAGLVERHPDPSDRRAWRLFLTPRALDLLQDLQPFAEQVMDAALEGVSPAEQARLRATLDRIRRNLARRKGDAAQPVD